MLPFGPAGRRETFCGDCEHGYKEPGCLFYVYSFAKAEWDAYRMRREKDYSKGKKCKVCGQHITNRSEWCRPCLFAVRKGKGIANWPRPGPEYER